MKPVWRVTTLARYGAPTFLSAFLLFQVQPMLGKYILPWFGGGPAVWTTCILFLIKRHKKSRMLKHC